MSLGITTEIEDNKATLYIDGRLAYDTAPELDEVFRSLPADVDVVACDLRRVNYVSSAGLRAFVRGMRIMNARNGKFKILNPSDGVFDVFRMTGLCDIMVIVR